MDTDAQIAEIEELRRNCLRLRRSCSDGRLVRWVTISVAVTVLSALCFALCLFWRPTAVCCRAQKSTPFQFQSPLQSLTPVTPVIAEVIPDTAQAPDSLCRVALTDLHQATARVTELIALRRSIEDIPIVASSDPAQRPRAHSTRTNPGTPLIGHRHPRSSPRRTQSRRSRTAPRETVRPSTEATVTITGKTNAGRRYPQFRRQGLLILLLLKTGTSAGEIATALQMAATSRLVASPEHPAREIAPEEHRRGRPPSGRDRKISAVAPKPALRTRAGAADQGLCGLDG